MIIGSGTFGIGLNSAAEFERGGVRVVWNWEVCTDEMYQLAMSS
jgi:hypothetical protein